MAAKKNMKSNDLVRFLTSEEGKIVKGDIVKIAAVLGIIGGVMQDASASHSNYLHNAGPGGAYHTSHSSHASHGSHSSHGQW